MIKYKKLPFLARISMTLLYLNQLWILAVASSLLFITLYNKNVFHTFISYIRDCIRDYQIWPIALILFMMIWIICPIKMVIAWIGERLTMIHACCDGRALLATREDGTECPIIYDGKIDIEIFDVFMKRALADKVLTDEEFANKHTKSQSDKSS